MNEAVVGAIAAALIGRTGASATSDAAKLYVGYSGGLDSTVLLHAAHGLYPRRVAAVHVNHGLHSDARLWQQHCATVCAGWQIALFCREVSIPAGNVEAAARAARYDYFSELLDADDVLLLAHHQDDQAETVLLRIAQGRGLIGMPETRPLGAGRLLRPLLRLPRRALEDYARRRRLPWVEDPSNADPGLDRNYLRARVMPELRARWPAIGAALEEVLSRRREVDELLLANLDPAAGWLAAGDLGGTSVAARTELLRVWLQARGAVAPSGRALQSFVRQLDAPPDRQPALDLNSGSLRRHRERIYHVADRPRLAASYALDLPGSLRLPHGVLQIAPAATQGFAARGAVSVVFAGQGGFPDDALLLRGHRRRVNKLLQAAGVPPWERGCYPLLVDAAGIVAVPGVGVRDRDQTTHSVTSEAIWEARWQPYVR